MEDETLVQLALEGDDSALRTLHDRYVRQVFQYAYTQTGDYHRAEEIAQDILFKMAQNLAQFKGKSRFKTWLFTIGRRVVIDDYRKRKKHRCNVLLPEEEIDRASSPFPSVEEQVLHNQVREEILKCLQKMPVNDRTVLHLRFIEGFSIEDTAKVMSKTKMAVKSLQTRAKRKLADLLRKEVKLDEG